MGHYLDKLYPGRKGTMVHHLVDEAVDAAAYGAASFGYGYLMNRYRDKATVRGVPLDLLSGIALSLGAFVGEWKGIGGHLTPIVRTVGHAGIGAYAHTRGAGMGAHAAGLKRLLIHESDLAKAQAALPGSVVLGAIPKAAKGDYLSASQLAALAR